MKKKRTIGKRIAAGIMSLMITVFSMLSVQSVQGQEAAGYPAAIRTNETISVQGESHLGKLLSDVIDQKAEEQAENNGINVFSIEVTGNVAVVNFETTQNCTLVVGIYDENGIKMLASGYLNVLCGEKEAAVNIETDSMPQYFYVRGFLVDTESFRPLCTAYESPNYTKEMQDFLAKTTEDFPENKVLNLDADKNTNFAVFSDEVKVIPNNSGSDKNKVTVADDQNSRYVIENADSYFMTLKSGDIFAYQCNDTVLIAKVKNIVIEGNKVTVTGADTALNDVFDYVKIDGRAETKDAKVDASTCEEGVRYLGLVESEDSNKIQTYAVDVEVTSPLEHSIEFVDKTIGDEDNYVKLNGGIRLSLDCTLKLYAALSYQYAEVKIDYSAKVSFSISAQARAEVPLVYFGFSPVPGVYIEFAPTAILEAKAQIDITGKFSGAVGFSVSSKEGYKNLTESPKFDAALQAEGSLYFGISLEPKIKFIDEKIAKISMNAEVGTQVTASIKKELNAAESSLALHQCKNCLKGDISAKYELSFHVKFLDWDKLEITQTLLSGNIPIGTFYYSFDFNDFNFGNCPHYQYLVTITVIGEDGLPTENAVVNGQYKTDSNGKTKLYLTDGRYQISAQKDGKTGINNILVSGKAVDVKVVLGQVKGNYSIMAGAKTYNGHSYYVFKGCNTWEDAREYCESLGGYLAVISDEAENIAVYNIMKEFGYSSAYFGYSCSDGEWKWVDGEESNYENWSINEPNNEFGREKYAMFYYKCAKQEWNDGAYGEPVFICEWQGVCNEEDNKQYEYNGHQYYVYSGVCNTWEEAKAYCESLGGHLAVINDAEENFAIYNIMKKLGYSDAYFGYVYQNGEWKWVNDEKSDYINWAKGEPNNDYGGEKYGMFYHKCMLQQWNDGDFGVRTDHGGKAFICEWDSIEENQFIQVAALSEVYAMESNNEKLKEIIYTRYFPNEIYNLYVMKSKTAENPFSAENLLYIGQTLSDETGNLSMTYEPDENYETQDIFVMSMNRMDIAKTLISVSSLSYTGQNQTVKAEIFYNGRKLIEGQDYQLSGDVNVVDVGTYTLTVEGIGDYQGKADIPYAVGKLIYGDANKDGTVNSKDVVMMKKNLAGYTVDIDLAACDVNGDNTVNSKDVVLVMKKLAGYDIVLGK